jgi:hypothetical protein
MINYTNLTKKSQYYFNIIFSNPVSIYMFFFSKSKKEKNGEILALKFWIKPSPL